ncbi:hypothetical protein [Pseudarthrobacter sp. NBSH8]|uniref:hypothetical protein n=1 Tax=Pseudarthrobacter sp. NBSH8 TaxID=2596911 RepID=UPI0021040F20|nr:hypothetical protein [Pseudarthrobacter sp. NBSH8]
MALSLDPAPGGRRQAFFVAVRMARRDIRRHKGRSLLIILLIMLPLAGMAGAAALVQSTQETAAERVQYQLGATQARFRPMPMANGVMVQDPVEELQITTNNWDTNPDFTPADPQDAIPAGYDVLTESTLDLTAESGAADVRVVGRAVDALSPAFAGKYTLLDGRAPGTDAEMLVSPGLLERFGLGLGEELATSAGMFVAVGTLRDAGYSDSNSIVYLKPGQGSVGAPEQPASAGPVPTARAIKATMYYLVGSEPVTWSQVLEANAVGVTVLSRSVVLDPPPPDQRGPEGAGTTSSASLPFAAYAAGALLGALALLEVGLLAGAAFAVGAKGQVRELALLAATGAESPTIRSVVMAAGLWLGGIGVAAGAAVGLAAAAGVVIVARLYGSVRFPGFHPDALLTVLVMGYAACLLAALAPARQVARQAVLGALKSGRSPA